MDLYPSGCICLLSVTPFAAKGHPLLRPDSTGPDSLALQYIKGYESWQRRCPPPGARPFLHPFCGRLDKKDGVWRDATRRFFFGFIKKVRQQINDLLRSGHKKAFEEAKVITQG